MRNILKLATVICLSFTFLVEGFSENAGPWNLDSLYQAPQWEVTYDAAVSGMTSLYYKSIDYKGNPVEVFAYYSAPEGEAPEGGWPALVHAHGGGGTAYPEWVQAWNDHGYACISMDLEGHIPIKDEDGNRLPTPNPGPKRDGIFAGYELPIEDQWYYHAISQIVKANSLIQSFPEINPEKIGISGASWGGTLTATAVGVDTRFSFAIPVYGGGFISGSDGNQGVVLVPGSDRANFVNANYDGSAYFDRVTCPTLWVNGSNDTHFDMTTTQRSAQAVNYPATMRFTLRMRHNNLVILDYDEIYAFADQVCRKGSPLPLIKKPQHSNNLAYVNFNSENSIESAELLYTLDEGNWVERFWVSTAANIADSTIYALIPDSATTLYLTATDARGLMLSSEYLSLDESVVPPDSQVVLTGISLNDSSLHLFDGDTKMLFTSFSPSNASNKDLTWSSNSNSVATVSSYGLLTASGAGSATIMATSIDGGFVDSCIVTVSAIPLEGISLSPGSFKIEIDETRQLTASLNPLNASNKNVNWSSSDDSVASVNSNGLVRAKKVGSCIISVTSEDGGYTASSTVTVENVSVDGVIVFPYRFTLLVGELLELSATVSPENAYNKSVSWSSSDTAVASVDTNGVVSAIKPGLSLIAASCEDGGYSDDSPITVNHYPCIGISISSSAETLNVGDTLLLSATLSPIEASYQRVSWNSEDTTVVRVDSIGLLTALGAGNANITVTSEDGGCSDNCAITVIDNHSGTAQIQINPNNLKLSNCAGYILEIYTTIGKLLSKEVLVDNEYSPGMKDLGGGIYIFKITNKESVKALKVYIQ